MTVGTVSVLTTYYNHFQIYKIFLNSTLYKLIFQNFRNLSDTKKLGIFDRIVKGPPSRSEDLHHFPELPMMKPSEKYNDETHQSERLDNGK